MTALETIVLAVIEGVTEFIPISSTGHMLLAASALKIDLESDFVKAFIWVVQLPAICAVILYFWKRIWPLGKAPEERNEIVRMWTKIAVAFVPSVVLGLLLNDFLEAHFHKPLPVAVMLLLGGTLLVVLERVGMKTRYGRIADISYATALGIGLFQCVSMMPGTSRSAATIIGAMLLGASRPVAAEFSFFLAVPTMLAATVYSLMKHGTDFSGDQWQMLALGSVVSFAVAYASVAFLMNYIQRHDFRLFGYYRIVLAVIVLVVILG